MAHLSMQAFKSVVVPVTTLSYPRETSTMLQYLRNMYVSSPSVTSYTVPSDDGQSRYRVWLCPTMLEVVMDAVVCGVVGVALWVAISDETVEVSSEVVEVASEVEEVNDAGDVVDEVEVLSDCARAEIRDAATPPPTAPPTITTAATERAIQNIRTERPHIRFLGLSVAVAGGPIPGCCDAGRYSCAT